MDKKLAKRKVATAVANQLELNAALVFTNDDGSGAPLSETDRQRMRNAYSELITFLRDRAKGHPTARW